MGDFAKDGKKSLDSRKTGDPADGLRMSFERKRMTVFTVLIASYVMVYFHRFAPGVVSDDLKGAFGLTAASLGSLAAMYFYIYALMQIPSGILADSLGPRRTVLAGNALAGVGSILFGLAPVAAVAGVGRFLVGLGVSVVFVAVMKFNASWFSASRYGRMTGTTLLIGNIGSVLAATPLALLVAAVSWRSVFVGIGLLALVLAILSWWVVRDRPEHCGFKPVAEGGAARATWRSIGVSLVRVCRHYRTWAVFIMNFGVTGGLYAFMGLWGVRLLSGAHGLGTAAASGYITVLLLAFAFGCVFFGWLSDRLKLRKAVLVGGNLGYLLLWLVFQSAMPSGGFSLYLLMGGLGVLAGASTLGFAVSKESNDPHSSGVAVAVVNMGTFVGVSVMQPLFGWLLDARWRGALEDGVRVYGFDDYQEATLLMVAFALLGFLASLFTRETRCQNITFPPSPPGNTKRDGRHGKNGAQAG